MTMTIEIVGSGYKPLKQEEQMQNVRECVERIDMETTARFVIVKHFR